MTGRASLQTSSPRRNRVSRRRWPAPAASTARVQRRREPGDRGLRACVGAARRGAGVCGAHSTCRGGAAPAHRVERADHRWPTTSRSCSGCRSMTMAVSACYADKVPLLGSGIGSRRVARVRDAVTAADPRRSGVPAVMAGNPPLVLRSGPPQWVRAGRRGLAGPSRRSLRSPPARPSPGRRSGGPIPSARCR
jgi:hypothetical protein